jgi:lipid-A-disaccharide synthase
MVSAGELSGDLHGAYLINELKRFLPDAYFFGIGSERLAAAGVEIKFDLSPRSTIGILEALPNLLALYRSFRRAKSLILAERPDLVILIDSQGFNLPLAKFCRGQGVKTVYYIAPQEWLWGTDKGVARVLRSVTRVIAIFPKEYEKFRAFGENVVYFGHPLLDIVKASASRPDLRRKFDLAGDPVVALCAGSREHELKTLLPVLVEAARLMRQARPDLQFIVPVPVPRFLNNIEQAFSGLNCIFVVNNSYDALSAADLAVCVSGTVTLEASLLGLPNIMIYKLSRFSYFIGKYFLKIDKKIKFFSMPNIVLDKKVIPELIMDRANPLDIAKTAGALLASAADRQAMSREFSHLKELLGRSGVIRQAAKSIFDILSH